MKSFGFATKENLPKIYHQNHKEWDKYMSQVWYNLLSFLNLKKHDRVIEVGAGNSIKIGLALAKFGFEGDLFLVDPTESILLEAEQLYSALIPEATIYPIPTRLADALSLLPKHPDYILSNHPLDDMLMAVNQPQHCLQSLFDWTSIPYEKMLPISDRIWSIIKSNTDHLTDLKKEIVKEWLQVLDNLQPSFCVISQYPSATLKKNGLNDLNFHATTILNMLMHHYNNMLEPEESVQDVLNHNENFNDLHISTDVLNAKNWLVLRNMIKNFA